MQEYFSLSLYFFSAIGPVSDEEQNGLFHADDISKVLHVLQSLRTDVGFGQGVLLEPVMIETFLCSGPLVFLGKHFTNQVFCIVRYLVPHVIYFVIRK
jgi:hypothetical protein